MPRTARIKEENAIYHIIARSISEVQLFKADEDKEMYLKITKEYQKVYFFKIYAYCVMDNHLHFLMDVNGADISKIMHCINFKYAQYFNKKYKRHGHLFQDRFKSKIIKDERYLINLSAYIHNNPVDIKQYEKCIQNYKYSSLAVYLGMRKDLFGILDNQFVLRLFSHDIKKARKRYLDLVLKSKTVIDVEAVEFNSEKTEYRSERKILVRNFNTEYIIDFITNKFNIDRLKIFAKNCREVTKVRALLVFFMRCLCNKSCKDICSILGNITQSRISKLCSIGVLLIDTDIDYKNALEELIGQYC